MPVSPKRRAANKRNALKSTGPKTVLGRKTSARNSIRHGLSVPLPPHINNPLQLELSQLIQHDDIPPETARDLAQKIIEYERNMSFLKLVFEEEMVAYPGYEEDKNLGIKKWQRDLEDRFTDIYEKHLKGMPWGAENIARLTKQMNQIVTKAKKDEFARSKRYFKRSSNQLIKALRRL